MQTKVDIEDALDRSGRMQSKGTDFTFLIANWGIINLVAVTDLSKRILCPAAVLL